MIAKKFVVCKECNYSFKMITRAHLLKHNMTFINHKQLLSTMIRSSEHILKYQTEETP